MTKLALLPLIIAVVNPLSAGVKGEHAIRELVADFSSARNASDSARLSRLYAEDAEYIPFGQSPIHGREAIEKAWSGLREWQSSAERTVRSIRFIKSDVAVVQVAVHFQGKAALNFTDSFVVAKKAGRWRIVVHESIHSLEDYRTLITAETVR